MPKSPLEKFEEIAKVLDKDVASQEEVALVFQAIIKAIEQIKTDLSQNTASNNADLTNKVQVALDEITTLQQDIKDQHAKFETRIDNKVAVDIDALAKQLILKVKELEELIPEAFNDSGILDRLIEIEAKIPELPAELTSEQVVDKVNDEEAPLIKKDRIDGLEDEIKSLRKEISTKSSGGVRRVFQPHRDDFSSLTDGVTKTFYLTRAPLNEDTVMIFGTDFPIILRPTVDFTIVNKTLTLTSAVPAPTTGATLIIIYFA